MYEEYKKFPTITKRRMFYEKMEQIMPGLKVVITDGGTQTMLPLESFTDPEAGSLTMDDLTNSDDNKEED